ncbi:MAG: hypothetical protein NC089_03665 [Bacteroides sp.]|nr:hypothetical protein [Bacteroides sp.]MCM1549736.1 hypothetical protein [Clostridium sp.]
MKNTRFFHYLNDFSAIYIFIMTFAVAVIVTLSQDTDTNLAGGILVGFLIAFGGSIFCLAIRFCIAYRFLKEQAQIIKKIIGVIYFILGSILAVVFLIQTLYISNWSITAHETLFHYTNYQLFMSFIMITQWIGINLFIK